MSIYERESGSRGSHTEGQQDEGGGLRALGPRLKGECSVGADGSSICGKARRNITGGSCTAVPYIRAAGLQAAEEAGGERAPHSDWDKGTKREVMHGKRTA